MRLRISIRGSVRLSVRPCVIHQQTICKEFWEAHIMVYFKICLSVHLSVSVFSAIFPYDLDNITLQPKKKTKIRTRAFGALTGV